MIYLTKGLDQQSMSVRIITLSVLGLASFLIVFGLFVKLNIEVDYFLRWRLVDNYGKNRLQADRGAILNELWIRGTMPPLAYRSCYTNDAYICNLADAVSMSSSPIATAWYLKVVISLISALAIVIFVGSRKSDSLSKDKMENNTRDNISNLPGNTP
jgi:hypothetical protein